MWRNSFKQTTIKNYKALQLLYRKNNQPFHLKMPSSLNTDEDIQKFSREITNAIAFPEFHYLTAQTVRVAKDPREYTTYN